MFFRIVRKMHCFIYKVILFQSWKAYIFIPFNPNVTLKNSVSFFCLCVCVCVCFCYLEVFFWIILKFCFVTLDVARVTNSNYLQKNFFYIKWLFFQMTSLKNYYHKITLRTSITCLFKKRKFCSFWFIPEASTSKIWSQDLPYQGAIYWVAKYMINIIQRKQFFVGPISQIKRLGFYYLVCYIRKVCIKLCNIF